MTLTVDMRSEGSPHIGLWRYGNCELFNLHRHSTGWPPPKSMLQLYYSINCSKTLSLRWQLFPITEPYESEMSKLKL